MGELQEQNIGVSLKVLTTARIFGLTGCVVFSLLLGLTAQAAVSVKVLWIDREVGRVKLLLPMHYTTIEASIREQEENIRIQVDKFYEAQFKSGQVGTTKRNYLRIRIPNEKPVLLRLRKISFLEP